MTDLEARLGHEFRDPALLTSALTHPSFEGGGAHYQRLEFLGDAVVQLAVSRWLYEQYPDAPEGILTRARAALVKEGTLGGAAARLGLGDEIRMAAGEARSGGREKPSILSDAMEAVIAAIYLDGGCEAAFQAVYRALRGPLEAGLNDDTDYKTRLQECVQGRGMSTPVYEEVGRDGPAHDPLFTMRVVVDGAPLAEGRGHSKQSAQQAAAKTALAAL